jgi:hypothetical protein
VVFRSVVIAVKAVLMNRLRSSSRAMGRGLAATARVISAAAAIRVVVFLSFDLTPDVSVKQIEPQAVESAVVR